MLRKFFLNHKKEIKYKDVEHKTFKYVRVNDRNEKQMVKDVYTITGIGKKAIKYQKNHGDDEFIFYDNRDFEYIAHIIIKSFDNELWNEDVRKAIAEQKQYCKEHHDPHFAPQDGFCWSCGKQIYVNGYEDRASSELITGCPHCHRSYCD